MCQMCQRNDEKETAPGNARPPRPSLAAFVANQRNTGLPWCRTLALIAANTWRKLRARQNCCGNLAQPGC